MPQNKQRDRPRSKHEKRKAPLEDLLPIEKVEHGIVYTKDGRYIKVLEVAPINFLMRSAREQRNLLYSFISYLKVCPVKGQIKVLSKKSDISRHIRRMKEQQAKEQNPHCAALQDDYIQMVQEIGSREAVTRRFFLAFQYEPFNNRLASESDAISSLQAVANTAANYFRQCGSEVIEHANEDEAQVEIFYTLYQRCTSQTVPLASRAAQVVGAYMVDGHEEQLNDIPLGKFLAPPSFSVHSRYIVVDGQYQSYHIIPGDGYKSKVFAGWLAPLVNAGEGVDLDIYWTKEPKDRIIQKLGQQLRINRSKIKDASDTNTDFDDLENAIGAGYYLKNGLANNEDFFYVSTLITISGQTEEEMEWRINEVRKLLASQDTQMTPCYFRQEQAFLSALPLVALDKQLGEMSRRNMLTSGFASFFPFISYEISDENGIFIGINKTNNSLIIMDQGQVLCSGATKDVFDNPGKYQAARLTGCRNISPVRRLGDNRILALDWNLTLTTAEKTTEQTKAVAIRPHCLVPVSEEAAAVWKERPGANLIPVNAPLVSPLPFDWEFCLENNLCWTVKKDSGSSSQPPVPSWLRVLPEDLLLLT